MGLFRICAWCGRRDVCVHHARPAAAELSSPIRLGSALSFKHPLIVNLLSDYSLTKVSGISSSTPSHANASCLSVPSCSELAGRALSKAFGCVAAPTVALCPLLRPPYPPPSRLGQHRFKSSQRGRRQLHHVHAHPRRLPQLLHQSRVGAAAPGSRPSSCAAVHAKSKDRVQRSSLPLPRASLATRPKGDGRTQAEQWHGSHRPLVFGRRVYLCVCVCPSLICVGQPQLLNSMDSIGQA